MNDVFNGLIPYFSTFGNNLFVLIIFFGSYLYGKYSNEKNFIVLNIAVCLILFIDGLMMNILNLGDVLIIIGMIMLDLREIEKME
jgi:predicted membrane protein